MFNTVANIPNLGSKPMAKENKKTQMPEPVKFEEWILAKCSWIDKDNEHEEQQRWRKWQEILKFFGGEQLIWWTGTGQAGHWKPVDLEPGDPYYASNIFKPYVNALIAELYRSNARLLVSAKSNQWKTIEAAQVGQPALDQELRRIWTDEQILRNLFFFVLYGNSFPYTTWNPLAGDKVSKPNYTQKEQQLNNTFGLCLQCQQSFESPAFPASCPQCGQPLEQIGQEETMQMTEQEGQTEIDTGDIELFILDPVQIKLQLSARNINESAYLKVTNYLLMDVARHLYGYMDFKRCSSGERSPQRAMIRQNETMVGNMTGMGAFSRHEMMPTRVTPDTDIAIIESYWLRPALYSYTILSEPYETEKFIIPANVRLGELFPKGMIVSKSGDLLTDMDMRSIDKHWTHLRYQPVATKIWGDGVEDLIQGQREYNELRSAELENAFHNATPATIINPKKIKRGTLAAKARQVVLLENARNDDNPSQYIYQPPARQLGGDIPMFKQGIKGDMQLISGAPIGESGIAGSSSDTATGMQILRDWTNSKLSLKIGPLNGAKVNQANQVMCLIQEYWNEPRFVKISNEVGLDDGRYFSSADLRGELLITVQPGSWWPHTPMTTKDNILQSLVAGGVPFGIYNPSFPRPAAVVLVRELGLPVDLDGFSMHARKQREEIENIIQILQMGMQYQVDPVVDQIMISQALVSQVPVEETDDHMAHIETIKYYMNTDMGRKLPPMIKQAIISHMKGHKQAIMMQQMEDMMMAGPMLPPPGQGEQGQQKKDPSKDQKAVQAGQNFPPKQ